MKRLCGGFLLIFFSSYRGCRDGVVPGGVLWVQVQIPVRPSRVVQDLWDEKDQSNPEKLPLVTTTICFWQLKNNHHGAGFHVAR